MTLADLPDILTLAEVADVMRVTPKAIYNRLAAGTFLPAPFARKPHRWRKADLEAWTRGEYADAIAKLRRQRRFGLATDTKARGRGWRPDQQAS